MQEKEEEDLRQALNKVSEVGIDEVGRGSIFGPVFSAVVVLTKKNKLITFYFFFDASRIIHSINSKKLIPLYAAISGTSESLVIPGWVFISKI